MDKLEVGHSYVLKLSGTRGEHRVEGLVTRMKGNEISIKTLGNPGREISIPRNVIVYAKRKKVAPEDFRQPDSNTDTNTGAPSVQTPPVAVLGNASDASHISTGALDEIVASVKVNSGLPAHERDELLQVIEAVRCFHGIATYREKKHAFDATMETLRLLRDQNQSHSSEPESLIGWLSSALQNAWNDYSTHHIAQIEITSPPATQAYVLSGNTFTLQLSLAVPSGAPDVESVYVAIESSPDFRVVSPPPMIATITDEFPVDIPVRIRVSDLGVNLREISLSLCLNFVGADGKKHESERFRHVARLSDSAHQKSIRNPFASYSGGIPIDDSDMFFGREELLTDFATQLKTGPLGQCFVLYGQKRSGKSSVLKQLRRRLPEPVICIEVSLGEIDTKGADGSFIQLCIDGFREFLLNHWDDTHGRAQSVLESWPSDEKVAIEPMQSFRRALRTVREVYVRTGRGVAKVKPVILVDEFTYIHEYIRQGIMSDSFMRQWKALLQTSQFSAVVAGQDTMREFIAAYPNEFAVTHSRRLNYLSKAEAKALADQPIQTRENESRYKGTALDRVVEATGGSPFYTQIVCDHIVRRLNRENLQFVSRSVVDETIKSLVQGRNALDLNQFDPLIMAANDSAARFSRDAYLEFFHYVALETMDGPRTRHVLVRSEQDAAIFDELIQREVLVECDGRTFELGVDLFSEWLRQNG